MPDLKTFKTPSCDFQIQQWLGDMMPVEDIEVIEEQAREEEAAAAYDWIMREAEYQRERDENNFGNKQFL